MFIFNNKNVIKYQKNHNNLKTRLSMSCLFYTLKVEGFPGSRRIVRSEFLASGTKGRKEREKEVICAG